MTKLQTDIKLITAKKSIDSPVMAFIDMGTNSFHLIVFKAKYNNFEVLATVKEFTPFFRRCLNEHYINSQSLKATINILTKLCFEARSLGASSIVAVATSAVRESKNGEQVLEVIRQSLKIEAKMISGKEEARLIYLGVLWNIGNLVDKSTIVDIGGGSVELILGDAEKIYFAESYKLGCARLTQRYFSDSAIKQAKIFELHQHVKGVIEPACNRILKLGFDPDKCTLIGSSGTIEAIAKLNYLTKKVNYQTLNQTCHSLGDWESVLGFIEEWSIKNKKIKGISAERNKTILAGAIVAIETMRCLGVKNIIISNSALREGLTVDSLIRNDLTDSKFDHFKDFRQTSVINLASRYCADLSHSNQVAYLAVEIFRQTQNKLHNLDESMAHLLWSAAILHDIGVFISRNGHHKHSFHLIKYSGLLGHSEEEINLIANIARYHRGSYPKESHQFYNSLMPDSQNVVLILSAILRMAEAMDRSHKQLIDNIKVLPTVSKMSTTLKQNYCIYLKLKPKAVIDSEIWAFREKREYFENILRTKIELIVE